MGSKSLSPPDDLRDRAEFAVHGDRFGGEKHAPRPGAGRQARNRATPEGGYPTPSFAGVTAILVSAVANDQVATGHKFARAAPDVSSHFGDGGDRKPAEVLETPNGFAHVCSVTSDGISLMSWPLDQVPFTGPAQDHHFHAVDDRFCEQSSGLFQHREWSAGLRLSGSQTSSASRHRRSDIHSLTITESRGRKSHSAGHPGRSSRRRFTSGNCCCHSGQRKHPTTSGLTDFRLDRWVTVSTLHQRCRVDWPCCYRLTQGLLLSMPGPAGRDESTTLLLDPIPAQKSKAQLRAIQPQGVSIRGESRVPLLFVLPVCSDAGGGPRPSRPGYQLQIAQDRRFTNVGFSILNR